MRTKIIDPRVLATLATGDVNSWLSANGWALVKAEPERYFRFTKGSGSMEFEVEVPYSVSLRDYARRMADVLDVLEVAEDRPQATLLRDIRHAQVDIARIRITSDSTRGGRIPVDQGATFMGQARDMMLAAACASIEKRPVFSKRKPTQAMEYLRELRFGPSEEGSYVATIESPVPPVLQLSFDAVEPAPPFGRRVMLTLADGLRATSVAAASASATRDISPFVEAVGSGLNANLCDAVAGMLEAFESAALEIGVGWAHSRPANVGAFRVNFAREIAPVLREASRILKDREPQADVEVEGIIVKLESDDVSTGGVIVVACPLEGRMRKVRASLDSAGYARAVDAHRHDRQIALDGDLAREGVGWLLRNARNVRIREDG